MKSDSRILKFVQVSPWPIFVFFVIPFLVVLGGFLHISLPLTDSKYPLLYNNVCFTLFAAVRLLYYIKGIYGNGILEPKQCDTDNGITCLITF